MQTRILSIDDSLEHQYFINSTFGKDHFISQAFNLAEASRLLSIQTFDLILLDISLPDGDGLTFLSELLASESTRNIPVILITSHSESNKEIMGFSLGIEDYIVKPVEPARLRARIESRLKQINGRKNRELILTKGNLKISVTLQKVVIVKDDKEIPIDLTQVEFKLLFHLLRHEEHIFTREQLLSAVWGKATDILERTIDMHVSNLRKKISESDYQIKAIHGTGYRMMKSLQK